MSNQIRDLVHTVKSTDLTPTQIGSAFGEIFLSKDTLENQLETQEIVDQFRSVKLPTYGQHIPCKTIVTDVPGAAGLVKLMSAETNTVYKILALSADNAGNVTGLRVGLTDSGATTLSCVFVGDVAATTVTPIPDMIGITFDIDSVPAILVTSGSPDDITINFAYCEVVQ